MRTATELDTLRGEQGPICLAAGFFDGVHEGHRLVLNTTVRQARKANGSAWVLTFETHPLRVLRPREAPPLLTTNEQKVRLLACLPLDGCLLLPFSRDFSDLEPEAFLEMLQTRIPSLHGVVVGQNWRFGRAARGTSDLLSGLGAGSDLDVKIVPPLEQAGRPVSSTRVRKAVGRGDLAAAQLLLGRPFSAVGTVTPGRTVGRKLGFPTANLESPNEILPPVGVYAVHAVLGTEVLGGVLNLGFRPTYSLSRERGPLMELHLLSFQGDLYGRGIEVFFRERLRGETRFDSEEALRSQIARDARQAADILSRKKPEEWLYTYCTGTL